MLPGGSADPGALRPRHRDGLSARQPDRRGKDGDRRGRRLRPRRDGPVLGYRSLVPPALQADAAYRAGHRVSALYAVGSGAQGRAGDALGRRVPALCQGRPDDPHGAHRGALCVGRAGALHRIEAALRIRDSARHRGAVRRSQARRARRAPYQGRRQPLPARTQCEGGQGRPQGPAHAVLDRQIHLPHRRRRQARRTGRLVGRGVAALRARPELSVDGALPPALPRRARRGAPDLRHADRDRRRHGLRRPARGARRRTLHEALFPGRQGCRRPDPHLLRDPRNRSRRARAGCRGCAGARRGAGSTASRSMATG